MAPHSGSRNPDSSRARVIDALRRGPKTLEQLVLELGVTRTAIRLQLAVLEGDGSVVRRGLARGRTKPSYVFELTPSAEEQLSRAYIPVLTQLLHVLAGRLSSAEFDAIMRDVGRGLVADRAKPRGTLRERVSATSRLLTELGGLTEIREENTDLVIQSHGCPLAARARDHPETCAAMESLVGELVGATVKQRCDRTDRPRCCFQITPFEGETAA
jgi:predicted ArsR family transcriptional regulator